MYENTNSGLTNPDKKFLKKLFPDTLPLVGHMAESNFAVPWSSTLSTTQHGFVNLVEDDETNSYGNSQTTQFAAAKQKSGGRKPYRKPYIPPDQIPEIVDESEYEDNDDQTQQHGHMQEMEEEVGEEVTIDTPVLFWCYEFEGAYFITDTALQGVDNPKFSIAVLEEIEPRIN